MGPLGARKAPTRGFCKEPVRVIVPSEANEPGARAASTATISCGHTARSLRIVRRGRQDCPGPAPRRSAVVESAEPARARRMAELAERLRLDLPDTLAGHREADADLLEGVVRALADPEAETQDLLLARG